MTAVIKIRNDYCLLETDNTEIKGLLWKGLRFHPRNYFFSPAYRQKRWDGYVDFFNRNSGKFMTGLLHEIEWALQKKGVSYIKEDLRETVNFNVASIDENFLYDITPEGTKPVTLIKKQVQLVNLVLKHGRGIIQAPTSFGKTYCLLSIIKALPPGTPILILGNRLNVVRQNYKELKKWGFPNVGLFDGKTHEPNIITCCNLQSIRHLERLLPKFRVLIVDEVHMLMSPSAIKAYKKLTGCVIRVAISATPFKYTQRKKKGKKPPKESDGDLVQKFNTKGIFGPVFEIEDGPITTTEMQAAGRLSPSRGTFYIINQPKIPHDIFLDAVTNGIAQSVYFHKVVSTLAQQLIGRTLILVERLAHGDALHQLIPGSMWVRGESDTTTRDLIIENLQNAQGNFVGIATKGIFDAAINVFVHNLINAAGGQAEHEIIQRIGRGLRTADDKTILNYYDFVFRINDYLEKHSNKRVKILKTEGHDIEIKEIDFM